MKVLFLHPNIPDYLSAGIFHGLRILLGKNCLDLPRFDCMYKPLTDGMRRKIRGNGFTLYGLLDELPELAEERFFIWFKNIKDYDLYIVADIWNHWDVYRQLKQVVPPEKIVVIDPSDSQRVFPFNNYISSLSRKPSRLMAPFHKATRYYKRELPEDTRAYTGLPLLVAALFQWVLPHEMLPIHFAIPTEKIKKVKLEDKVKLFTNNIVDEELNNKVLAHFIPLGQEQYSFTDETEYYKDIQQSKFGITTKRSGWDCLRHYEFAANGAVLCFKSLDRKPATSAPHGLNATNCITYHSYDDLMHRVENMSSLQYEELMRKSYEWIESNTTIKLAEKLLNG